MRGNSYNISRVALRAVDFSDVRTMEDFVEYQVTLCACQFVDWHSYNPLVIDVNRLINTLTH